MNILWSSEAIEDLNSLRAYIAWALQASLTHSINDDSFAASGLDASAFAGGDLGRIGFGGGKICSVGAVSSTSFSRSEYPLSAHPERARARSVANTHFIFCPDDFLDQTNCIMRPPQAPKE